MTEKTVLDKMEKETPNVYNQKKPWHSFEEKNFEDSSSLFFAPQATSEKAPEAELTEEEATYKKRYDDLKKHYDRKVNEHKQREEELLAQAKSVAPQYKPPKTMEELQKFKKDYPDLYATVETVAHLQSSKQLETLEEQLKSLQKEKAELSKKDMLTQLKEDHPDFEQIRDDDRFHDWAKTQPDSIQAWIYSNPNRPDLASRAISLYKADRGIKSSTQRNRPDTAAMISTKTRVVEDGSPKVWSEREIQRMSVADYDKYKDAINQAIAEGRITR